MLSTLALFTSLIGSSFLTPNELNPIDAYPIWRLGETGTYVSVGSERSFIGAASSDANGLVVIDRDPAVIRFAQINAALLKASLNLSDYRFLRMKADANEWAARGLKPLEDIENWKWWEEYIRHPPKGDTHYGTYWARFNLASNSSWSSKPP